MVLYKEKKLNRVRTIAENPTKFLKDFTKKFLVDLFQFGQSVNAAKPCTKSQRTENPLSSADIGNCRGVTEARKIAQLCALYDVGIQFHCANSHLNVAATLQLEAAIPNFTLHEHCCVHERDYVRKLTKFDYQPRMQLRDN